MKGEHERGAGRGERGRNGGMERDRGLVREIERKRREKCVMGTRIINYGDVMLGPEKRENGKLIEREINVGENRTEDTLWKVI